MKIIIFGATGMVGQGALRECLADPNIDAVLVVVRSSLEFTHPKLRQLTHSDFSNYQGLDAQLAGYDATFFCLGTPSAGKSEPDYTQVTYGYTLAAAETLVRLNPKMVFIYVSGQGADSTEKGRVMWARVRGKTENALLRMPFKGVYIFRPGVIEPLDGIHSKTTSYRILYSAMGSLLSLLRWLFPKQITSTREIARAMIGVAREGYSQKILTAADFYKLNDRH